MPVLDYQHSDGLFELRFLKALDQPDVYDCMADWDPDERGPYTWNRTTTNMSQWLEENRAFDGQGPVALVLTLDGAFVGIAKANVQGTHAYISFEAITPEQRGKGYFSVLSRMLRVYGFETLGVRSVSYTTREDPGAVASDIDRMAARTKGQVESRSGRQLTEYEYDEQSREAGMDAEEAELRGRVRGRAETPDPRSEP